MQTKVREIARVYLLAQQERQNQQKWNPGNEHEKQSARRLQVIAGLSDLPLLLQQTSGSQAECPVGETLSWKREGRKEGQVWPRLFGRH